MVFDPAEYKSMQNGYFPEDGGVDAFFNFSKLK